LFSYKNPVARKIIWELKYHYKYKLAEDLGQFLFDNSKEKLSLILKDSSTRPILIVPIPLSRKKRWRRGYNQSDYIARGFCSCVNSNLFLLEKRILFKNKNTSPQAKIKVREERLKNIQGVFFIKDKEKINGKTIIIIDDVVTTGGTIKEAMRVLKDNGAEKVYVLTLAH
jgi:ComF family protein